MEFVVLGLDTREQSANFFENLGNMHILVFEHELMVAWQG